MEALSTELRRWRWQRARALSSSRDEATAAPAPQVRQRRTPVWSCSSTRMGATIRARSRLLAPVLDGSAALTLGSRIQKEHGAMHLHQRAGNALVAMLVRTVYGVRVHDVPPMRAIRGDALDQAQLREMTYGWPTEMLVKAVQAGFPIEEIEVSSRRRRGGVSKVSGCTGPSLKAGATMLAVVARYA